MRPGKTAAIHRRNAANLRKEERAKRTPREQIALLDSRFGVRVGAKKERARLEKLAKASP
jgi:hypothetical protein